MHIGAQAQVVGQLAAHVIRIFVDHDLVRIPEPVAAIDDIHRSDVEAITAKAEASRSASREAPNVVRAETTSEVPMLPRMVEMETGVVAPSVMSDPPAVLVHVRRLQMTRLIIEGTVFFDRMWIVLRSWSTRGRRMHWTASAVTFAVLAMLREREKTENQGNCQKSRNSLHPHLQF
jgi:hypothetical protein